MLLAVLILASSTSAADVNVAPVIGVLYQPIDSSLSPLCPSCSSYVVSSYVQWLQGAGARVALLDWNSSVSVLGQGFEQVRHLRALAAAAHTASAETDTIVQRCTSFRLLLRTALRPCLDWWPLRLS